MIIYYLRLFIVFIDEIMIDKISLASLCKRFISFFSLSVISENNSKKYMLSSASSSTIFNLYIKSAFDLALQAAL